MSDILFRPEELAKESKESSAAVVYGNDVCEDVLSSKMNVLALNDARIVTSRQQSNCDGSDSGLDMAITVQLSHNCQDANVNIVNGLVAVNGMAFKNSNGNTEVSQDLNMSCNSSLISCDSDLYDCKANKYPTTRSSNNYEWCSDNGSESSSIQGKISSMATRRLSNVKKKVAMFEPAPKPSTEKEPKSLTPSQSSRKSGSQLQRAVSLPRSTQPTSLRLPRERTQEKPQSPMGKMTLAPPSVQSSSSALTTPNRSSPINIRPQKPDSLPNPLNRKHSISMQRLVQRTPSLSRARTPGTPSDDGRWPSVTQNRPAAARRGMSVTPDLSSLKMRTSMLSSNNETLMKNSPSNGPASIYSTLPRRRKQQSIEDLSSTRGSRSNSISRESRMTSSVIVNGRKSLLSSYSSSPNNAPNQNPSMKTIKSSSTARKSLQSSANPTPVAKTKIYHETSVQTALTNEDLEKAFSGHITLVPSIDLIERRDQGTQSDIRDREVERLHDEVSQLKKREQDLINKLQRERDEKNAMQRELTMNTERVLGMLEMARYIGCNAATPSSDDGENLDSLLMLESQIQLSGHELVEKDKEIGNLRKLCLSLQVEIERSVSARKTLLEEKISIEQESIELQDFLQHEKAALCDALKEMEADFKNCQQILKNRDEEIKVLRDECRHLVRLNEQRRQENRMWQTKYNALETKSKELIVQQNSSVAGASAALSGLHTRLDSLVEQLVFSYNISENDLEDLGFQSTDASTTNGNDFDVNELDSQTQRTVAAPNSLDLSGHNSQNKPSLQLNSDGSLSPQRNQSFITAVISAIRNATSNHSGKKLLVRNTTNGKRSSQAQNNQQNIVENKTNQFNGGGCEEDSDSTEMLDSETEPCLMMDNVLEDVVQPDSHSHNMVSSCMGMISQIEVPSEMGCALNNDTSLHNLSQAIANRQQIEMEVNALTAQKATTQVNQASISEDVTSCHDSLAEMPSLIEYSTTQAVVDQVIEVDSIVTKLLKVLRLIQLDNDNCIQQLIIDKNKLQENKEDMLEKLKDLEDVNIKLQDELMDATQELMLKNNDLTNTKAEMQRHRNEIDRLTEDICTLSTLCSNYKKLSPLTEFPPMSISSMNISSTSTMSGNGNSISEQSMTLSTSSASSSNEDIQGILNLLKIWCDEGQLKDSRIATFLAKLQKTNDQNCFHPSNKENTQSNNNNNERLQIYANQLENILTVLSEHKDLEEQYPAIKQMRHEIETVKKNANWTHVIVNSLHTSSTSPAGSEKGSKTDLNANGS